MKLFNPKPPRRTGFSSLLLTSNPYLTLMKLSFSILCLSLLGACSSAPEAPSATPSECAACTLLSAAYDSILASDFDAAELAIATASDRPMDEPHSIRALSLSHLNAGIQLLQSGDATGASTAFSQIRDAAVHSAIEEALAASSASTPSTSH